jgi:hypothetical protein
MESKRFEAPADGKRSDLLQNGEVIVAVLKIVVWYAREYMVHMMQADVARKPLQQLR